MPEETRVTTQPSSQSVDDPHRLRALDRTLLVGLMIAALTSVSYVFLYFQMQAWQILAVAVGVASGAVCLVPARRQLRAPRNDLNGAGYWSLAAIVLAFGVGEVFWINNTLFATAGALLLFLSVGSLVRPRRWGIWAAVAVAYGGFIVAVNQIQPLPRYDIAQVQLLNAFIPVAIGVLLVVVLWLIARAYLNYSLRTKLIVAFLAVSLGSVGAITLYADRTIRLALQERASAELTNVAQSRSTAVGDFLAEEVKLLQTLALSERIRSEAEASNASYQGSVADTQAALLKLDQAWRAAVVANDDNDPLVNAKLNNSIASYLREYRTLYPENAEVFVTDRHGALLGATNRTSDYYQADEDWWQAAYSTGVGTIYYSQPTYETDSGAFSINIALPVYDKSGSNMLGILRTTVDLAAKTAIVTNLQLGEASLLLPDNSLVTGQGPLPVPSDSLAQLPADIGSVAEMEWEGQPSFVTVAPVRASDPKLGISVGQLRWKVIAHQPRAEILAPVAAQTTTVLLVFALIAIVVTGVSIGLSQILVRPITRLTMTAKKVAAGDLTAQATVETKDEIGTLAVTFNNMTNELRNVVSSLEERVQARTEQLRASAEVGRTAASVLDPDDLLRSVVNLITERFGFYYAAVFTSDSQGRYAILREATGEAGSALKAQGHQLEIGGQSMVGNAIARRRLRIALDVGAEAIRFANPLLPDTRSEIALPLVVGDQVLGALDVQSTEEAAFDESNAAVLQSMADQIAIALSNALSYTETQAVARRSRALFAASREVGRVQADVADTIRAMMQAAADTLEYDRWCVLTFNEVRTALVTIAAHDWPNSTDTLDVQEQANHPLVRSALHNEALQINDPRDARWQELAAAHLSNLLSVPIVARGTLIGVVGVSRSIGAALTDDDVEVGRSLATLAAIAIENYRLLESSQRTLRELDEVNRRLTGEGWERFARRRGQRDFIWVSRSDQLQPQPLPEVAEALTLGHVATRLLDDGRDDQSSRRSADTGAQLGVAVPIKLRDVPIGALRMIVPLRAWTTEMAASLESIAGHVAQAAENARLIAESEERLARERALTEATEKVRQRNEIDSVLETAATELAHYLNVSRIAVHLTPQADQADGNGHTA